jgi:hypothetical protein
MGDQPMTAHSVGVDYCLTHCGIRNEDEESCNWRDDNECETCGGTGAAEDDDPGGGTFDCADCDGDGHSPCDLRPLVWIETDT